MTEKEKLEKDIEYLGQVIKIVPFNMQNQIKKFKNVRLDNYYNEFSKIERDTEKNDIIEDEIWDIVVNHKNISEYD